MGSESHADTNNSELNADTVEFIFEATKDIPERQLGDAKDLDTKVVQLFSAASVVIGLVSLGDKVSGPTWSFKALIVGLVVSYTATALATFVQLRTRKYARILQVGDLWQQGWNSTPTEIQHALIANVNEAYTHNRRILEQKARLVQIAVVTTGVEVLLVGLLLSLPLLG